MAENVPALLIGNAVTIGKNHRGWFVGHFMESGPLKTDKMEAKIGNHPKGTKSKHIKDRPIATLTILISGKFQFSFPDGSVHFLEKPFDFIFVDPGQQNSWEALEDSVTITIRTPSIPE